MANVPEPRDATTPRLAILDYLESRLVTIQKGGDAGRGHYYTTVRKVFEVADSVTSLHDGQMPCILLFVDDEPTTFDTDAGGDSAGARWPIALALIARDDQSSENAETSKMLRILEVFMYDVVRCIRHRGADPCLVGRNDVMWNVDSWKVEYIDTKLGVGVLQLSIVYEDVQT